MLTLGPIPRDLQTTVERWILDARANDPHMLMNDDSLFIAGGPAWCNSISPDGTIWIHDYSENPAVVVTDEKGRIKTIVIAGKHRPELLVWLPIRPESALDCTDCATAGWRKCLGEYELVCETCSGLGWILADKFA